MKRDRLGRFLSPAAAGQRGGTGGGRTRGRPARSGPSVDEAAALVASRLGWGPERACEDGADEAGRSGRSVPTAPGLSPGASLGGWQAGRWSLPGARAGGCFASR